MGVLTVRREKRHAGTTVIRIPFLGYKVMASLVSTMNPRVGGTAMIDSVEQALAELRRRGALPMRALVDAVAGEAVRGSWWGHPRGQRIFAIASALEDSGEALAVKLEGRVAFLHRSLWPALRRAVTDPAWRGRASRGLGPAARALLSRVQRSGEVVEPDRHARREIEAALLAWVGQEHTASGRHRAVVRSWRRVLPEQDQPSLEEALARLAAAGVALP